MCTQHPPRFLCSSPMAGLREGVSELGLERKLSSRGQEPHGAEGKRRHCQTCLVTLEHLRGQAATYLSLQQRQQRPLREKSAGSCPQHQSLSQHWSGSAWFPGTPAACPRPRDISANMKKAVQGAGEHTRRTDGSKRATSLSLPQDDSFEEERGEWL